MFIITWPYIRKTQCLVIQLPVRKTTMRAHTQNMLKPHVFDDQPLICILAPLMDFRIILLAPCEVFLCVSDVIY